MDWVYLGVTILGITAQNVFKKQYNLKCSSGGAVYFFNLIIAITVFLVSFGLNGFTFQSNLETTFYSLIFGAGFSITLIFAFLALSHGSLALTSLVISYSLVIPCLYGILFLGEEISASLIAGILLLFVSLFLFNYQKGEKQTISPRWWLFAFCAFVGNGTCAVVQKVHQIQFPGLYRNEFMMTSMLIACGIHLAILALFYRKLKRDIIIQSFIWGIPSGIANGTSNLLVMVMSASLSASFMYPVITAGGIVTTFLLALTYYRERQTQLQYLGFIFGLSSIILMSI